MKLACCNMNVLIRSIFLFSVIKFTFASIHLDVATQVNSFHEKDSKIVPISKFNDVVILSAGASSSYSGVISREVTSGLIAALATLPTSISYASLVGVNPLIGVWTTVILGTALSAIGGAPAVIAGAAGVVAIPMSKIMQSHGYSYMTATVILGGILECLLGIFRMGSIVNIVKEPVIAGFLNAFAVFLVKSQLKVFKNKNIWMSGSTLLSTVGITATTIALMQLIPYITKTIPSSLGAITITTIITLLLRLPLKTLKDIAGKDVFSGGISALPVFRGFPTVPFTLDTVKVILPPAIAMALICELETLLSSKIISSMTKKQSQSDINSNSVTSTTTTNDPNRASIGLGIGTAIGALFGGFGGCGLIPNTILNGKSGGQLRLSSIACVSILALFVLVLAPIIAFVPMASLAGLMLTVAFNTVEWKETREILEHSRKSKKAVSDLIALVVTMILCYKVDMGLGVAAGVLITSISSLLKWN
eukprot:gene9813-20411_t